MLANSNHAGSMAVFLHSFVVTFHKFLLHSAYPKMKNFVFLFVSALVCCNFARNIFLDSTN